MKNSRRHFLRQFAAGGALAALGLGRLDAKPSEQELELEEAPDAITPMPQPGDDWDTIRGYFKFYNNQTYLNNGTIGIMPRPVLTTLQTKFLRLSRGLYNFQEDSRETIAKMLNASTKEIAFTANTTSGLNIVSQGLRLKRGDEVILSDQEHVGNALPWLNRARRDGIRIKVLHLRPTAEDVMNSLDMAVTKRTRAIALPHITCTNGQVLPVKEISEYARERGIFTSFDGAHGAGMLFPDVAEIGCDFYAGCGHKWLCGPAGTGFLYVRHDSLEKLEPVMVGADSDNGWDLDLRAQRISGFVDSAHRFEFGTQNNALFQGMKTAADFMEAIGFERVRNRSLELGAYLQSKLVERIYVDMISPLEYRSRSAMIGFRLKGVNSHNDFKLIEELWPFRLRWVPESDLNSIRVSTHIYNSPEQIDKLVEALDKVYSKKK